MRNHARPPWGVVRSSFLAGPCRQIWVPAGPHLSPKEAATTELHSSPEELHPPGQIGKVLNNLPPPNTALQNLHLDMMLIPQHNSTPVGGRTALFAENWRKLSQDPWIHSTITGYQLPLQFWPKRHHSTANLREDQRLILQSEIHKLEKRCRSISKASTYLHNKPYVCGSQNRWRLEANHRPKISQLLPTTRGGRTRFKHL